jgi:hypothetical protein
MIQAFGLLLTLFLPLVFTAQDVWTEARALEVLTPSWVSSFSTPKVSADEAALQGKHKHEAASFLMERLLSGGASQPEVVLLRLRGVMSMPLVSELHEALKQEPARVDYGVDLLLTSDWRLTYDACLALLLDSDLAPGLRVQLVSHLILAAGRPALLDLQPLLDDPNSLDDLLFFRFLSAWQSIADSQDAPALQQLARRVDSWKQSQVRVMQARLETRPSQRLELFNEFWDGDPDFVEIGLLALSERGFHEGIAKRLRESFGKESPNRAQIALRSFAFFTESSDTLFEVWKEEVPSSSSSTRRQAPWMRALAMTSSDRAKQAVAEWLFQDGWQSSSLAISLFHVVRQAPAFDSQLDAFLLREDVPVRLRAAAAIARVLSSEGARHFLRGVVETGTLGLQRQAMIALSQSADSGTLTMFIRVFQSQVYPDEIRVIAVKALARHAETQPLLLTFLKDKYESWEVASGLVEAAIQTHNPEIMQSAQVAIQQQIGCTEYGDALALARTRWGALASLPLTADCSRNLALEFQQTLFDARGDAFLFGREWVVEFPMISSCSEAYARSIRQINARPAHPFLLECDAIASAPLYFAATLIAATNRPLCGAWCEELLSRKLTVREELLVLGLLYRVSYAQNAATILEQLRGEKAALWQSEPFALSEAFPGQGGSWVLHDDRLAERQILALAEAASGMARFSLLRLLNQGYATPEVLLQAAELAARTRFSVAGKSAKETRNYALSEALRLAQRAEAFHPFRVRIRERIAEWAVELGLKETAASAKEAARRFSPSSS